MKSYQFFGGVGNGRVSDGGGGGLIDFDCSNGGLSGEGGFIVRVITGS